MGRQSKGEKNPELRQEEFKSAANNALHERARDHEMWQVVYAVGKAQDQKLIEIIPWKKYKNK